jgi:hypothetical protein
MNAVAPTEQDQALTRAWEQQSVWSQTADRLKQSLFRTRTAALILIIIAAFAGAFVTPAAAVAAASGVVFAWVAAACAGMAAVLQTLTKREHVEAWTRVRSVSEAYKAEVYTYLAGVAPYRGADKLSRLVDTLREVAEKAEDLKVKTLKFQPRQRPLPPVTDVDTYIAERVEKQISGYYRKKSREMARRAAQFRTFEIVVAIVGALLSAAAGSVPNLTGIAAALPVLTTIAAVVAAEMGFRRYDALALEYERTADQLENLLEDHDIKHTALGTAADDDLVHACELVISIQNEAWMARPVGAHMNLPTAGGAQDDP